MNQLYDTLGLDVDDIRQQNTELVPAQTVDFGANAQQAEAAAAPPALPMAYYGQVTR